MISDTERNRDIDLNNEKQKVERNKFDPFSDVKAELSESSGSAREPGTMLFGTAVILVFSFLLFATGLYVAVTTAITVFGLIVGIIMMIVAVCIPFLAGGNWMNKFVSKQ
jgi:hypothetical protein